MIGPGEWPVVPALLLAGLTWFGVWETRRHTRTLRQIPIRIHVNGTRGKSSVTRLIAGGLRAGGIRTVAKTTGTMARLIFPDGQAVIVKGGEWVQYSTPEPEGAQYIAVCLPAFAPETVHRDG